MSSPFEINKAAWANKLESHLKSDFYNMNAFLKGKSSLNSIELDLLGDIRGKKILHLQCHFGQDSISLSRLGAEVTGVDFSESSIAKARELAQELGTSTQFICSNIYDLEENLDERFDLIFTSYGTIAWLPDLKPWAKLIQKHLKPNGQFILVEFHPLVWIYDDEIKNIVYPYWNKEAIVELESGSYADRNAEIEQKNITWNHALEEVFEALMNAGLQVQNFKEYDFAPYHFVEPMEEYEPGKHRIKGLGNKIPLVYSLKMNRPS